MISVIVPIYNTSSYLKECLDSILIQTYNNFELICVDDGSTDNSLKILEEYALKDDRIKIITQENSGAAIARNKGLELAKGNYICFVDSDDTVEKRFLEKINNCTKNGDYNLVVVSDYDWYQRPIKNLGLLPTCAILIKKDWLNKYPDVRFPAGIRPCEDGIFSHKIITLTQKIGKCIDAKYFYRQRCDSSEHSLTPDLLTAQIPIWLNIIEEHYEKYNLWNNTTNLLTFLMIEPYYRLKTIPFNKKQKKYIINLLLEFIKKHNINRDINKDLYSSDFIDFINTKSYHQYLLKSFLKEIIIFTSNIFSLTNSTDKRHKVITILGFKIKIRRKNAKG